MDMPESGKKSFVASLLAFMVLAMLFACSSTDERSDTPESSSDCGCPETDLDCIEQCAEELPFSLHGR
jgi:hypothetical protein